jgi:hypothetical protein
VPGELCRALVDVLIGLDGGWRSVTLKALGWDGIERTLNSPKIKRKYVWTKSGGLCWYCGAQLYCPGEADSEFKKQFVFTTDHVHPRSNGGRGRANKVPACKYCNSHKSSRSIEEFRQWLQALVCEQANHARALGGEYGPRRWKVNSEAVVFYFELARLLNSGLEIPFQASERFRAKLTQTAST